MFMQPDYAQVALSVAVGVGVWGLSKLSVIAQEKLRETRTVKFLRAHYATIDAVLDSLPDSVSAQLDKSVPAKIFRNPIAPIVEALVNESDLVAEPEEVVDAIHWAGEKFSWNVHGAYDPSKLSPIDKRLVDAATKSVIAKFEQI